jgi:hypothetical protein
MRWRDLRFEKPTEKDADDAGDIIQMFDEDSVIVTSWAELSGCIAWMPVSELPQPDLPGPIPDGWRPVDKAVDKRDPKVFYRFWHEGKQEYIDSALSDQWFDEDFYIAPIDPPAPQYRPFATWQEWWPHRDRWVRNGLDRVRACWFGQQDADARFKNGCIFLNDDGTDAEPFGVLVTESPQ